MTENEKLLVYSYLMIHLLIISFPFVLATDIFKDTRLAKETITFRLRFLDLTLTGLSICRAAAYWGCYSALVNLSFVPPWAAFAITVLIVSRTSDWLHFDRSPLVGDQPEVPFSLIAVEAELLKAQAYVQSLSGEIASTIDDLKKKEELRAQLEVEIKKKETEHEEWQKLSEAQKEYFVQKIFEHSPKQGWGKDFFLVVIGFILNLVASAVWSLLGNPGKKELLDQIHKWLPVVTK